MGNLIKSKLLSLGRTQHNKLYYGIERPHDSLKDVIYVVVIVKTCLTVTDDK